MKILVSIYGGAIDSVFCDKSCEVFVIDHDLRKQGEDCFDEFGASVIDPAELDEKIANARSLAGDAKKSE